jgi:hypothetical protein
MDWKKQMQSPEAGVYPYLFKEQVEKNAVLVSVLQIAFDALKGLADEKDPEKIRDLAKVTCEVMTRTLDSKVPPQVVKASDEPSPEVLPEK